MKIQPITSEKSKSDTIFNEVVKKCEFYRDKNGEAYLIMKDFIGYELKYLSNSDESKKFIRKLFYSSQNATAKTTEISIVYETICSLIDENTECVPVFTRVAFFNNTVFYDLANSASEVVEVSANSIKIVKKKDITGFFFFRDPTMQEQVKPLSSDYGIMDFAREFFHILSDQFLLLVVYICTAYIQYICHPVLILEGEKGAGKTTVLDFLKELINPVSKEVFSLTGNTDSLVTTLSNNHFVPYDNVGNISDDVSNILCQASTRATMTKRKLYTDNTEICINIKRIVAINGINLSISQSDLLDRAILVTVQRIESSKMRTLEDLKGHFKQKLPSILSDIFNIIKRALEIYPSISLTEFPRMADFSKYGYAIAEAIHEGYGSEFLRQYNDNIKYSSQSAVEENPFLECIKFIACRDGYYESTMTELLQDAKKVLARFYIGNNLPPDFPKTPNAISRKLRGSIHELKESGINVKIGRASERFVVLQKIVDTDEFGESLEPHKYVADADVVEFDDK